MKLEIEQIRDNYSQCSDEELCKIALDTQSLTPEAALVLEDELKRRGLTKAQVHSIASEVQASEAERPVAEKLTLFSARGTGFCFFGKDDVTSTDDCEEYTTTMWFQVFFFPIVPIASYRVRMHSDDFKPRVIEKIDYDWPQIGSTFIKAVIAALALYIFLRLWTEGPHLFKS